VTPNKVRLRNLQSRAVYFVFAVGTVASVFLATFWSKTTYLFGADRSSALLSLVILF
jgi:hypothetical protein